MPSPAFAKIGLTRQTGLDMDGINYNRRFVLLTSFLLAILAASETYRYWERVSRTGECGEHLAELAKGEAPYSTLIDEMQSIVESYPNCSHYYVTARQPGLFYDDKLALIYDATTKDLILATKDTVDNTTTYRHWQKVEKTDILNQPHQPLPLPPHEESTILDLDTHSQALAKKSIK
jgi:hypothetical protein